MPVTDGSFNSKEQAPGKDLPGIELKRMNAGISRSGEI
jgi:hypothetical protein